MEVVEVIKRCRRQEAHQEPERKNARQLCLAIVFQRLVRLLFDVAKNGSLYLSSLRLYFDFSDLSKEDDVRHNKMSITSTAKMIDAVFVELEDTTGDYQQAQISRYTLEKRRLSRVSRTRSR